MKIRVGLIQRCLYGIDGVRVQDFNTLLFKDEGTRRDRPRLAFLFFVITIPENESISVHCYGIGHESTVEESAISDHGQERTRNRKKIITHSVLYHHLY